MTDLKLVPIDDLFDEIIDRCDCFIAAYTMTQDPISPEIFTTWSASTHTERLGLASILTDALLRHYNEQNDR